MTSATTPEPVGAAAPIQSVRRPAGESGAAAARGAAGEPPRWADSLVASTTSAADHDERRSWVGRAARGFAALAFGQGIRTFGHVLLVPIYLRYWPAVTYGEWLALVSVTTYLAAFDLGLGTAGANRLTQAYARGDLAAYARYQATALAFYAGVAGGGSVLIALAAWRLPLARWLGLATMASGEAAWVVWLLAIQVLWAMPVGFLAAVYRTTGRLAWSEWLANGRALAGVALVPLVLALGGGMPALAASQLLPLAAVAGFVVCHGSWRWPALMPRLGAARAEVLRELMAPSLLFALLALANGLALQGAVLLVVTQLGGVAVAVFVTSRTLTSLIRQAVFTVNNALWPQLTAMEAGRQYGHLAAIHRLVVLGSAALSIGLAAALWQCGDAVIAAWTGGKLAADVSLLHLLLIQAVLQAPWLASSVFPVAFNRPHVVALATAASSVVGLGVAALTIGRFGVAAVPLGLVAGEVVACYVLVPREACRLIHADYRRFAVRTWLALAAAAAVAFPLAWAAARVAVGPAVLRWLEVGAIAVMASLLAACIAGLGGRERGFLIRRGRASLARIGLAAEVPGT